MAPDLDVVAFRMGISYANEFGHRGASHSLAFAALLGALACLFAHRLRSTGLTTFLFVFAAAASHGLLDMATRGGLGIALFWPLSDQRYFYAFRPIVVSPLSLQRALDSSRLWASELLWVWLPCATMGATLFLVHRALAKRYS